MNGKEGRRVEGREGKEDPERSPSSKFGTTLLGAIGSVAVYATWLVTDESGFEAHAGRIICVMLYRPML